MNQDEIELLIRSWGNHRQRPVFENLVSEFFPQQRNFDRDKSRLRAALCGRRAGKTRGRNRGMLREAKSTPGGRFLIINETSHEVRRLNWVGVQGDGIATTIQKLGIKAKVDNTRLTVTFPEIDSSIACLGVDDEAAIGKALGGAYHRVWWDEAQKIPGRFRQRIRETFMPTLLDFGGGLDFTGSPSRQMSGLFWDITQPQLDRRMKGWSVHEWNLLSNPHFGRVVPLGERFAVVGKDGKRRSIHNDRAEADKAAHELRFQDGIIDLQTLLGGPDIAPLDGPIMQREGFGRWVAEDSAFTYAFHKVKTADLFYAKHRVTPDGFVDLPKSLRDLPGWGSVDYFTEVGVDIGYNPDPFAFVVWAWNLVDPCLYEVGTWKATHLDSEQQAAILRRVREEVKPCGVVADAGNPARPSVAGWSKEWVDRYGIPVREAAKSNKNGAIENVNADMVTLYEGKPRMRLRDGSPLAKEYSTIQWASVRTVTGKLIEDPSIPNDCADAALYGHRDCFHHRWRPTPPPLDGILRAEQEMEQSAFDDDFEPVLGSSMLM